MKCLSGLLVMAVAGAAVSTAWAGPDRSDATRPAKRNVPKIVLPGAADGPGFADNFDTYANGSFIVGQGGWQFWDGTGASAMNATVDNALSSSAPNSLVSVVETDVVQVVEITSGQWVLKAKTYTPSGATGLGYFIVLNTFTWPYVSGGNWSLEVHFTPTLVTNTIRKPGVPSQSVPVILDQWVEIMVEVDLAADTYNLYYGGTPISTGLQWSFNGSATQGQVRIQCIDLYSQMAGFRWDDVVLEPAGPTCYANCDESTDPPILNVADFGCFLGKYAANDPYANCDGSTEPPILNVADFGCFLGKYAAGCP